MFARPEATKVVRAGKSLLTEHLTYGSLWAHLKRQRNAVDSKKKAQTTRGRCSIVIGRKENVQEIRAKEERLSLQQYCKAINYLPTLFVYRGRT